MELNDFYKCKYNGKYQRRIKKGDDILWRATDIVSSIKGNTDKNSYVPVEYIETSQGSNNTIYIDSELSGDAEASYEIVMESGSAYTNWAQFMAGDKKSTFYKLCKSGGNTGVYGETGGSGTTQLGAENNVKYDIIQKDGVVSVNGESKITYTNTLTWGDLSVWLFCSHGEPTLFSNMKLYSLKMWADGDLVRDFIPVIRSSDNTAGLYDKTNKKFYEGIGNGSFIVGDTTGEDKIVFGNTDYGVYTGKDYNIEYVNSDYIKLEYIESTGTQYIDTGISSETGKAEYSIDIEAISQPNGYPHYLGGDKISPYYKVYSVGASGLNIQLGTGSTTNCAALKNRCVIEQKDGAVTADGVSKVTFDNDLPWGKLSIWVFSSHGEPTYPGCAKLYSLKMWTDDVLVRDFQPAIRVSDAAVGLYDYVSGEFFENQGTGEFEWGLSGYEITAQVTDCITSKVKKYKYYLDAPLRKVDDYADSIDVNKNIVTITRNITKDENDLNILLDPPEITDYILPHYVIKIKDGDSFEFTNVMKPSSYEIH